MFLHEAMSMAFAQGLAVTRVGKPEGFWPRTAIVPVHERDCCYLAYANVDEDRQFGVQTGRRWNPLAEDLTADDWEVTDYIRSRDLMETLYGRE